MTDSPNNDKLGRFVPARIRTWYQSITQVDPKLSPAEREKIMAQRKDVIGLLSQGKPVSLSGADWVGLSNHGVDAIMAVPEDRRIKAIFDKAVLLDLSKPEPEPDWGITPLWPPDLFAVVATLAEPNQ